MNYSVCLANLDSSVYIYRVYRGLYLSRKPKDFYSVLLDIKTHYPLAFHPVIQHPFSNFSLFLFLCVSIEDEIIFK